jgi:3-oxoacyl-[acyl-carrier protein] reductase
MLTGIELIKATVDGMIERKWGRIVNITSGSVKAPIPILVLSNGARSGLTGAVGTIAREVAKHNVMINNLLPGPFATDRLMNTMAAAAKERGISVEELAEERAKETPAGRFGDPAEFGEACAFLCSDQAGYITAQSLLMDGGLNPALF